MFVKWHFKVHNEENHVTHWSIKFFYYIHCVRLCKTRKVNDSTTISCVSQ